MYTCDHCKQEISGDQAKGMNPLTGEPLCEQCANLTHYEFLFMKGNDGFDLWIVVDRQQGGFWLPYWVIKAADDLNCHTEHQVMFSCSALTWWDAVEQAQNAIVGQPEAWGLSL
jgi:hypothetical protein